jgi:hypothetical protein
MAKEIKWTKESVSAFEKVIEYLAKGWLDKEVQNFIESTELVLQYVSAKPLMFRKTNRKNLREALITSHNLMIYKIYPDHISIITFWDTRQNPRKKYLKIKKK